MSTKEAKQMDQALFDFYGKPSIGQALPLAIQHVLAMIVGCVTPSIIVAGVAGLSQEDSVILIQAALVMSALTTLLQLFPFIKTKSFRIGSALPVMMGISFAYVPSMQAIAADFDIATILGAQIVGGVIALLVGLNIKRIRKFFPPLITGTVVFSIGLSLYPTAINYMAGGASSKSYGAWQNWLVALITLVIVTVLNHYGKGVWKLASILIGNHWRIYCGIILWNDRFFIGCTGIILPTSKANAFWYQIRAFRMCGNWNPVRNQCGTGNRRLLCNDNRFYGPYADRRRTDRWNRGLWYQ